MPIYGDRFLPQNTKVEWCESGVARIQDQESRVNGMSIRDPLFIGLAFPEFPLKNVCVCGHTSPTWCPVSCRCVRRCTVGAAFLRGREVAGLEKTPRRRGVRSWVLW